jgi:MFS family permease
MPLNTSADSYKWIALSNTTLGILMAVINQSIVIIALPDIFRGIHLNPLVPSNTSYLLWMLLSFMVVMAVIVVSLGRVGDMFGRVRMYNLGFAVFTAGSILLSLTWMHGSAGALWMIVMRVVQGIGAAFLMANSSVILTDAFPPEERGLALGINMVAAIAGSFIGLVLGGALAPVSWRLVFLVSVPFGLFGTVWAYLKLEERGVRSPAKLDWPGNLTVGAGLIAVLVGHRFFPTLVSHPFATGIHTVFYFAAACCLVAAIASWMRGGKYYHVEVAQPVPGEELAEVA